MTKANKFFIFQYKVIMSKEFVFVERRIPEYKYYVFLRRQEEVTRS